jgi:hypothetical protein
MRDYTHGARGRGAFSLVEVLIAVFVLSLGMLGLASIFPVVLHQQRTAGEVTEGSIAVGSIEATLRSNLDLNVVGDEVGWGIFQDDDDQNDGWSNLGQWMTPALVAPGDPDPESRMAIDPSTSRLRIISEDPGPQPNDPFGDDVMIPLSARLGPGAFLRGANPRVEWVFAARRIITQVDAQNDPLPTDRDELEVVVFVRPIDRAIQVPRRERTNKALWATLGRSLNLSDVLLANEIAAGGGTPGIRAAEARLPVALSVRTDTPSNNGTGYYAVPYTFPLKDYPFDDTNSGPGSADDDRDRLQLDLAAGDPRLLLTRQIGQRLVDRRGNVYTVRGVTGSGGSTIVLIDPPVPASIAGSLEISELVASPVVPVAVEIFRVRP